MTAPQNLPPSSKPPFYERILDKVIESPFATLWNLTAILGGLIALIYFTQLGYLPDLDIKSSAAFFFGIAVVSIFLIVLLVVVFSIPSWMLRSEVQAAAALAQKRWEPGVRVALNGFLAAFFYLLMIGCFGLDAGNEELAGYIKWVSSIGMMTCIILIALTVFKPILYNFTLLLAWLMVTPSFWLLAMLRVRTPEGPLASLAFAGVLIAVIVIANAILAAIRFDTRKAWLVSTVLALALPITYLTLPSDGPGIPESVFKKLSLGGITNTVVIVKLPACDAVNVLQKNVCMPLPAKQIGCIIPTLMANRLGEYLLVFESGDRKIKVPLQKSDVVVWSSSTKKPTCQIEVAS
ncbi:hypothetical protein O0882_08060 [Janthinobacterium sp. SUN073]|uniref:hypothetical protein n=1 Tax=Janthinobacterium sp. SUN073 TaxID=3004102 RepID=UPI0025B0ABF9|nr:hypothetical protein [Janthinobacterium sp. SUN073]MDN2696266.1 hypothetical protein [Janthinobacterium sp. SUN073]